MKNRLFGSILGLLALSFLLMSSSMASAQKKDGQKIIPFQKKYTFKVGDLAWYQANIHPSVGNMTKVYSQQDRIFVLDSTQHEYDTKDRPIQPGGDSGVNTYFLRAVSPGTTTLVIQHLFRGRIENEFRIEIEVLDPEDASLRGSAFGESTWENAMKHARP